MAVPFCHAGAVRLGVGSLHLVRASWCEGSRGGGVDAVEKDKLIPGGLKCWQDFMLDVHF